MDEAIEKGDVEKVRTLLLHVDPSINDNRAIRWASWLGHEGVVKELLKDPRVDPSAKDNFAIIMASYEGYEDVVTLLLKDHRVDPSAEDNEAIRRASWKGQVNVVRLLLSDPRVFNWAKEREEFREFINEIKQTRLALAQVFMINNVFAADRITQNIMSFFPLTSHVNLNSQVLLNYTVRKNKFRVSM
jgi:hypothetical protein